VTIAVPTVEDLVRTKRWGLRQKDLADHTTAGSTAAREEGSVVKAVPLSPEAEHAWLESLDPPEFERRLRAAIAELDGPEGENLRSLIRWFSRKYPTARERLQYATRKHDEWRRWAERLAAGGGTAR
jgi:hypothetical protein